MLNHAKKIRKYTLRCRDGDIGTVKEFLFDDQRWIVRYLVIDTGGWLSGRKVLLAPQAITDVDSVAEVISVDLTKEQIESSPPVTSDHPVSRQMEEDHHVYYGWSTYWGDSGALGMSPYFGVPIGIGGHSVETGPETNYMDPRNSKPVENEIIDQTIARHEQQADPHLRSTSEVTGYDLIASNGEVGTVDDFIIDAQQWSIRYLIIATGHWWSGKEVLIAPHWIQEIRWSDAKVFITIDRALVKSAPEYSGTVPSPAVEEALHRHYDQNQASAKEPAHRR